MPHHRPSSAAPLDAATLERLALRYVERYATTRAKLGMYLRRKLRDRGWREDEPPPIEALVERFAALRYVDDRGFAEMRAASLARRGYGEARVAQALKAAGVAEDDAEPVRAGLREGAQAAALAFARRRRIGPFAEAPADRAQRQRMLAAMLRAGHSFELSRSILDAAPGEEIEP